MISFFRAAARIIDKISLLMGYLAGLWVVGMTLVLFYSVISRRVFNVPLIWDIDFTELAMVIMVYLGVAYTTQIDGHVAMDAVYMRLKPAAQDRLRIFIDLMIVLFAAIALYMGIRGAADNFNAVSTVAAFPLAPVYILIPVGVTLLLLQALVMLGRHASKVLAAKAPASTPVCETD